MKRLLAMYKSEYGYNLVLDYHDRPEGNYQLMSEPVEVEFKMLPNEQLLKNEINAINKMIDTIKTESIEKIDLLNQRKQELLALTYNQK